MTGTPDTTLVARRQLRGGGLLLGCAADPHRLRRWRLRLRPTRPSFRVSQFVIAETGPVQVLPKPRLLRPLQKPELENP